MTWRPNWSICHYLHLPLSQQKTGRQQRVGSSPGQHGILSMGGRLNYLDEQAIGNGEGGGGTGRVKKDKGRGDRGAEHMPLSPFPMAERNREVTCLKN